MMRLVVSAIALAAPLCLAAPASAQSQENRYAMVSIQQGNYASAEQKLLDEQRAEPGRPEVLLNLAAVYARTGRAEAARQLYQQVLDQQDVLMDLPNDRTLGSHALANTGLSRLSAVQFSAR